jgi:hypothetical protein
MPCAGQNSPRKAVWKKLNLQAMNLQRDEGTLSESPLAKRWTVLRDLLNEQQRRRWAAIEAYSLGPDGLGIVSRATGMARQTIKRGLEELEGHLEDRTLDRSFLDPALAQREEGGGRRGRAVEILAALESRMDEQLRGGDRKAVVFRWTSSSLRRLAEGPPALASHTHVSLLLAKAGYDIVAEPWLPERRGVDLVDQQFRTLGAAVVAALDAAQPVLVLNLSKARRRDDLSDRGDGGEAARHARSERVLATAIWGRDGWDEKIQGETLAREGWSVSAPDAHTVMLAVQTIRQWWESHGRRRYGAAGEILVVANALGHDTELEACWRLELSHFVIDSDIGVRACYLPTGICRWSRISDRSGAVLAKSDRRGFVGRHRVTCRVIEPALARGGWPAEDGPRRSLAQPGNPIDAGRVRIRYQLEDAPQPVRNWDFSVSKRKY